MCCLDAVSPGSRGLRRQLLGLRRGHLRGARCSVESARGPTQGSAVSQAPCFSATDATATTQGPSGGSISWPLARLEQRIARIGGLRIGARTRYSAMLRLPASARVRAYPERPTRRRWRSS
eukprot:7630854-Alexandrium_andersonii.AAC.1